MQVEVGDGPLKPYLVPADACHPIFCATNNISVVSTATLGLFVQGNDRGGEGGELCGP